MKKDFIFFHIDFYSHIHYFIPVMRFLANYSLFSRNHSSLFFSYIVIIFIIISGTNSNINAQQLLLSGMIYNTTGACPGAGEEITIQFISPKFSGSISLKPSESLPLSLPGQLYKAITQNSSGEIIESTNFLITENDWIYYYGCSFPELKRQTEKKKNVKVSNTTNYCFKSDEATFLINGKEKMVIKPSEEKNVLIPEGIAVLEIRDSSKNTKLFFSTKDVSKSNTGLYYGCFNPYADGMTDAVPLIVYNTTDTCAENEKRIHFIVRVGGETVAGLEPKKKLTTIIGKGLKLIEIINDETYEVLLKEEKEIQKPIKFHYGCEKPRE